MDSFWARSVKMFEIGQIVMEENYTQAALWCNQNGAHIENTDGQYVIIANPSPAEPSTQEQVQALEAQTGLTRTLRELVLAENSGASDYVKQQAREIEFLAAPLREAEQ